MWRGLIGGSLLMIVLYVLGQAGPSGKVDTAGNWASAGLRRFLAQDVAGIGDHTQGAGSKATLNDPSKGTGTSQGSKTLPA